MADITKDQVVDFLSNLTVMAMADLVKELEDKWGVEAATAVAVVPNTATLAPDKAVIAVLSYTMPRT